MRTISNMIIFAMAVCMVMDIYTNAPASPIIQAQMHMAPTGPAMMLAGR